MRKTTVAGIVLVGVMLVGIAAAVSHAEELTAKEQEVYSSVMQKRYEDDTKKAADACAEVATAYGMTQGEVISIHNKALRRALSESEKMIVNEVKEGYKALPKDATKEEKKKMQDDLGARHGMAGPQTFEIVTRERNLGFNKLTGKWLYDEKTVPVAGGGEKPVDIAAIWNVKELTAKEREIYLAVVQELYGSSIRKPADACAAIGKAYGMTEEEVWSIYRKGLHVTPTESEIAVCREVLDGLAALPKGFSREDNRKMLDGIAARHSMTGFQVYEIENRVGTFLLFKDMSKKRGEKK